MIHFIKFILELIGLLALCAFSTFAISFLGNEAWDWAVAKYKDLRHGHRTKG